LAIEPRFVYKGVLDLCDRSFTPVFGIWFWFRMKKNI
jgi:hypothetical protein